MFNDALRRGLDEIANASKPRKPLRTRRVDLGRVLIGSIDNIAETLAIAEGESFR